MVVVIPAYQPDEKLYRLVLSLHEQTDYDIVIVNDGSAETCRPIFDSLEPYAKILVHKVNRGKGAAMKTAFSYIYEQYPADEGVVTIDADGQHLPEDIIRVCKAWEKTPEQLVLGSREFTGNVPFKSRAGNAITRFVFALSTGVKVFDTQTGLRAFGVFRIPMMLEMKGDRYEYEINVLLYATKHRIPIQEVKIATVYIEDNKSSHFNPVRDAWRIYKMILMFVASSLIAMLIDYVAVLSFSALTKDMAQSLLISVVGARIISSLANYFINCKLVFEHRSVGSIVRYYLLAAGILAINYGMMFFITKQIPIAVGKIIVELLLYPLSFYVQRKYVFPPESEEFSPED
ncbi:MAG TPA: bifunctional glycosyltransferase family 2/GtrA family protein [Eubacteriales bacterium]|nr:bifunctional glycosyltransferase family 2/GtrA family protein [Eubacteriales bacterium]